MDKMTAKSTPVGVVVERLGLSSPSGGRPGRYWCPACNGADSRTPDLVTYEQTGSWYCFKGAVGGDVIRLVEHVRGESFEGALDWLGAQNLATIPQDRRSSAAATTPAAKVPSASERILGRNSAMSVEGSDVIAEFLSHGARMVHCVDGETFEIGRGAEYLAGRGLDPVAASAAGVRYYHDRRDLARLQGSPGWDDAGLGAFLSKSFPDGFLVFPYFDDDRRPVYVKGRSILSRAECDRLGLTRWANSRGRIPAPWNMRSVDLARSKDGVVLICEGETDALAGLSAGFGAVGVPGAGAWRPEWAALFAGVRCVVVPDGDDAGQKFAAEVEESFKSAGLPVPGRLPIPKGKDLSDVLSDFS